MHVQISFLILIGNNIEGVWRRPTSCITSAQYIFINGYRCEIWWMEFCFNKFTCMWLNVKMYKTWGHHQFIFSWTIYLCSTYACQHMQHLLYQGQGSHLTAPKRTTGTWRVLCAFLLSENHYCWSPFFSTCSLFSSLFHCIRFLFAHLLNAGYFITPYCQI